MLNAKVCTVVGTLSLGVLAIVYRQATKDRKEQVMAAKVEADVDHFLKKWDFYAALHTPPTITEMNMLASRTEKQTIRPVYCNNQKAFLVSTKKKAILVYLDNYVVINEDDKNKAIDVVKVDDPLNEVLTLNLIRAGAWD